MAVFYNCCPGYLDSPTNAEPTIFHYVRRNGIAESGYLVDMSRRSETRQPARTITDTNGCQAQRDQGLRHAQIFEDSLAGELKLLSIVDENPAVTLPNLS